MAILVQYKYKDGTPVHTLRLERFNSFMEEGYFIPYWDEFEFLTVNNKRFYDTPSLKAYLFLITQVK